MTVRSYISPGVNGHIPQVLVLEKRGENTRLQRQMRVGLYMILHWVCNLKVKYRTFNPTKKERYLPDLPYRNALDPLYVATEWS